MLQNSTTAKSLRLSGPGWWGSVQRFGYFRNQVLVFSTPDTWPGTGQTLFNPRLRVARTKRSPCTLVHGPVNLARPKSEGRS